jgi:hypothetical protein
MGWFLSIFGVPNIYGLGVISTIPTLLIFAYINLHPVLDDICDFIQ